MSAPNNIRCVVLIIFSKSCVLYEERLKITARVSKVREVVILQNEIVIAIIAKTTGTNVRMVLPRISFLLISGFFI